MNHDTDSKGKIKNILGEKWLKIAVLLMLWDIVAIHAAYFLALWFRFDCKFSALSASYLNQYAHSITLYSIFAVVVFWLFKMYRSVWRYATVLRRYCTSRAIQYSPRGFRSTSTPSARASNCCLPSSFAMPIGSLRWRSASWGTRAKVRRTSW